MVNSEYICKSKITLPGYAVRETIRKKSKNTYKEKQLYEKKRKIITIKNNAS